MSWYALRKALLSVAAVVLVVSVAVLVPSARSGWALGAAVAHGLPRGATIRASPAGVVQVALPLRRPVGPRAGFGAPVAPPLRVTRPFDAPPRPWMPGHRGVDLAAEPGATVWAAGSGEVAFAGPVAGRPVISIQHANGLRTTYEPVTAAVRRGDRVATGDPIGMVEAGHPGCPVAACLHWGLRRDDVYLNPLLLLGFRVRLLPL